ncbi:MAG: 30S ribosomal protein S12 methylthiotransferase RimO [Clostridia bacterium]|nr:30S ribosomal protein S12 methylthiotransferase RimO [Clostridia bacterium]
MAVKIAMVSLGCPKNQTDAEIMLKKLYDAGYELTVEENEADVIIVNTCGFIESAKKEAIDVILDVASLKKEGKLKKLIVTGCMAERYMDDIVSDLPEVDAVVGIGANKNIADIIKTALTNDRTLSFPAQKEHLLLEGDRILANPPYYAYLRIADGCDNKCTYCAIPLIRGSYRSRKFENIIEEAKRLAMGGVKELIVIAQDITRYGMDLYGRLRLAELLTELSKIEGIEWIRLLYTYPDLITDELLEVMANNPKVLKYIDIPLQHASGTVLKRMNRRGDKKTLTALIKKIRSTVQGVTIRTTFITGFPGETKEEFNELCDCVEECRFDRMGAFAYSEEEGTVAGEMPDRVDQKVRTERQNILMEMQYAIMEELNEQKLGSVVDVLVEGYDRDNKVYFGRTTADAPDIDCKIFFTSGTKCEEGDIVKVEISEIMEYDLLGKTI